MNEPASIDTANSRDRRTSRWPLVGVALLASWATACGGSTPPPDAPPPPPVEEGDDDDGEAVAVESEKMETGKDCATAEVLCDAGMCTATVKNDCTEPVTCEMGMMVLCRRETDTGEARGRGRGTVPAASSGKIEAGANCEGAQMIATQPDTLSCK